MRLCERREKTMVSASTIWTFTGLRHVYLRDRDELDLGDGFSLMKVNDSIRSGWDHHFMSNENYEDAEACGSYLIFRRLHDSLADDEAAACNQELQNARLSLKTAEHRPGLPPNQCTRIRQCDPDLPPPFPSTTPTRPRTLHSP